MRTALGVSFGRDRVYAVQVSRSGNHVELHAASSAAVPVAATGGSMVTRVADAMRIMTGAFPVLCSRLGASIPTSWSVMHAFPSSTELAPAALQERSRWEITQHCPDETLDASAAAVFVLSRDPVVYLSVAYPKNLLERLHSLFDALGQKLVASSVDPMMLNRAMRLNYADVGDTPIAIVDMSGLGGSITISQGDRMVICAEEDVLESAPAVIRAVERSEARAGLHAQKILVGGERLTSEILREIVVGKPLREVRRLNAFRTVVPHDLTTRSVAYCKRTAHLFSAAVGAALEVLDREQT